MFPGSVQRRLDLRAAGLIVAEQAAYEQLDQKLGGGDLPSKADRVKLAVQVMPAVFSKAELARVCPQISERTVKRVLDELRGEGKIEVAKRGRNAMWRKV